MESYSGFNFYFPDNWEFWIIFMCSWQLVFFLSWFVLEVSVQVLSQILKSWFSFFLLMSFRSSFTALNASFVTDKCTNTFASCVQPIHFSKATFLPFLWLLLYHSWSLSGSLTVLNLLVLTLGSVVHFELFPVHKEKSEVH